MVPRYRSNCLVIVVILLVLQIIDVSCSNDIDMCTNGTETGNSVFFTRTKNEITNCHCTINAANGTKLIFNTIEPTGCGLKLEVEYNSLTENYNCETYNEMFYTISNDEGIKLRLEPNKTGGFEFGFNITSQPTGTINMGHNFTISCYGLPDPPTTLSPSTSTPPVKKDTSPTTSTTSTETSPESTESSTLINTSATESANTTSSPLSSDTSSTLYIIPSTSRKTQKPHASSQSSLPGIVGGSVTAIVVIVILIIIVVCVLKRRKYKSKKPTPAPDKNNYYFQLEIPNENVDNGIVDHTYDNSLNTPPSKTNENTPADIRYDNLVISDNDLYVSSDAVENGLSSNASLPMTPETIPAEITNLVITDNDMYVSSGDIEYGTLPDTQVPKLTIPDDSHYQSIDSLDQTSEQSNVIGTPRPEVNNNKQSVPPKLSFEPEYTTVNKAQKPQGSTKTTQDNLNFKGDGSNSNGATPDSYKYKPNPNKDIQKPQDSAKTNGDHSDANGDHSNVSVDNLNFIGDTPNSNEDIPNSNEDTPNSNGDTPNFNGDATNSNEGAPNSHGDALNFNGHTTNSSEDVPNSNGYAPNFNGDTPNSNGDTPNSNVNTSNSNLKDENSNPKAGDSNSKEDGTNSNRNTLNSKADDLNSKGDSSYTQTNSEEQFTMGTEGDGYTIVNKL